MNHRNELGGHAKVSRDRGMTLFERTTLPNLSHVIFGQFGVAVPFTLEHPAITNQTLFCRGIRQIVCRAATEQVRGIAARTIVAVMASVLVGSKRTTFVQLQGDPVSSGLLSTLTAHSEDAVTARQRGARPRPARIGATRLIDVRPEAVSHGATGLGGLVVAASPRTEALGLSAIRTGREGHAAHRTRAIFGVHQNLTFWCRARGGLQTALGYFYAHFTPFHAVFAE